MWFLSATPRDMKARHQTNRKSAQLLPVFPQLRLTASAGLHDDDFGFVSQTRAVTVVENLEDGIIVKNIWLCILVLCPTDSFQGAM